MIFLVDENLSPRIVVALRDAGHVAKHVRDDPGSGAPDEQVVLAATRLGAVIVTADTDFGAILARSRNKTPSVILVRALLDLPVSRQGSLIVANVAQLSSALESGAIVVISLDGIRIRPLPLG